MNIHKIVGEMGVSNLSSETLSGKDIKLLQERLEEIDGELNGLLTALENHCDNNNLNGVNAKVSTRAAIGSIKDIRKELGKENMNAS